MTDVSYKHVLHLMGIPGEDVKQLKVIGLQLYRDRLLHLIQKIGIPTCRRWAEDVGGGEHLGQWYDTWTVSAQFLPMCVAETMAQEIKERTDCLCGECDLVDGLSHEDEDELSSEEEERDIITDGELGGDSSDGEEDTLA